MTRADKPRPVLRLKRPRQTGKPDDPAATLLDTLRSRAPHVWSEERPLPLAVGVHRQLFPIAEGFGMSRSAVRRFLTAWTSTEAYLRALAEDGAQRFDADGAPAGEVGERDRARARQRMEGQRAAGDE